MDRVLWGRTGYRRTGRRTRCFTAIVCIFIGTWMDSNTSEELIEELMCQYGTMIKRICLVYLKDAGLAEEAAQDTFVKAYYKMHTLQAHQSQKAWLSAIAVNTCKDYLRKGWIKRYWQDVSLDQLYIEPSASETDRKLVEAIPYLSKECKAVILMRYYEGLQISEISQQLHCSRSAVYRRLKKAQKLLRDYMED